MPHEHAPVALVTGAGHGIGLEVCRQAVPTARTADRAAAASS